MQLDGLPIFLELFRCPVGDKAIKSADVADLARYGLAIKGAGDLEADRFEDADED
jgi:hypothetical protein